MRLHQRSTYPWASPALQVAACAGAAPIVAATALASAKAVTVSPATKACRLGDLILMGVNPPFAGRVITITGDAARLTSAARASVLAGRDSVGREDRVTVNALLGDLGRSSLA